VDNDRGATNVNVNEGTRTGGRGCGCWILLLIILLGGLVTTIFVGLPIVLREEKPMPGEAEIADLMNRQLAVPAEYQDMRMPQKATITAAKGKDLFGAECAMCHGAGGKGDAPLGMTQYPPAADLTSGRTQGKTDGQLFWLIAHGINLTGMPAWGKNYGGSNEDDEIWSMVAHIRTLKAK
jgi:mono/diheme cytochrome c family protein